MIQYIHILGPSGSGTTTLGKKISNKYNLSHFDSDDYFWFPTDPPYQEIRPREKRQELLYNDIKDEDSWVISGSFCGWGDIYIQHFDLVIYLWVSTEIRIERLKKRERKEFGDDILPGGVMYENHIEFLKWAAKYDYGVTDMRSKKTHEKWMSKLECPVLRIEGNYKVKESVKLVDEKIKEIEKQV